MISLVFRDYVSQLDDLPERDRRWLVHIFAALQQGIQDELECADISYHDASIFTDRERFSQLCQCVNDAFIECMERAHPEEAALVITGEPPTLIDAVAKAIATDDDDRRRQSARLVVNYLEATPEQRAAIDDAFICLCGWSLKTLVEQTAPRVDEDDESATLERGVE